MSENIYEGPGLVVTRYVGPAHEGPDRLRWQFTGSAGEVAVFDRHGLLNLLGAIMLSIPFPRAEPLPTSEEWRARLTGEEDVEVAPLLDGATAPTTGSSSAVS